MRYRREQQYQQLNRKSNEEDCSWNSIIVWGICISVIILIILYISFGPSLYHPPPILVGEEKVSTLDEDKKSIPVYESTISIDNVGDIFYRYTEPRGRGAHRQPDVLILHGAKYGSQTWKGLGTLQIFSYWGYKTFAIDLPGYKLSKKATPPTEQEDRIEFIKNIINKLKLSKVVLIVPSMSGQYGLPVLLDQNANYEIDLRGFIAIAPQGTNRYTKPQYQAVETPVLVMYGERDKTPFKEESLYWMDNIPTHSNVMIKKGEHAAFVGNPEGFHEEILRFLATECRIGEDTDTSDEDLDQMYNDNDELFGYDGYDTNSDTDTGYYDSETENGNNNGKDTDFEQYLADYFAENEDAEDYYDDTDLYFDQKDVIDEEQFGKDNNDNDNNNYNDGGEDEGEEDKDSYRGIGDTDTIDPDLGDDGQQI